MRTYQTGMIGDIRTQSPSFPKRLSILREEVGPLLSVSRRELLSTKTLAIPCQTITYGFVPDAIYAGMSNHGSFELLGVARAAAVSHVSVPLPQRSLPRMSHRPCIAMNS